jgi:hypothetical protein
MIIYNDPITNNVHACTLISSVPKSVTSYEVPSQPDKLFREAWKINVGNLEVDLTLAKDIAHEKRRAKRVKDFEPYDAIITLNIPGQDAVAAEAARVTIRNWDSALQISIEGSTTVEELKALMV